LKKKKPSISRRLKERERKLRFKKTIGSGKGEKKAYRGRALAMHKRLAKKRRHRHLKTVTCTERGNAEKGNAYSDSRKKKKNYDEKPFDLVSRAIRIAKEKAGFFNRKKGRPKRERVSMAPSPKGKENRTAEVIIKKEQWACTSKGT